MVENTNPEPRSAPSSGGMDFRDAHYIKLGNGGTWEADSIENGIMRIGWGSIPLEEIHDRNWPAIERLIGAEFSTRGAATRDLRALQAVVESGPEDVWITFYRSMLWWCRLAAGPVERDCTSRFRRVHGSWRNKNARGTTLTLADIPGVISRVQGFRSTSCRVKEAEVLRRLLNGDASPASSELDRATSAICTALVGAIRELHWKDFETLVDLVFRQHGWRRISVAGETMKFADLELEEPVTGDRYQVQIKSTANRKDFTDYLESFSSDPFRRLYFVVHTPSGDLVSAEESDSVKLILPEQLARMVLDAGLVSWLRNKIS